MDIEITFINQSNDTNNSEIVIFQKNVAQSYEELAVAWLVIQNCGRNWSHKFIYPMGLDVGIQDAWGNSSPLFSAENGQSWQVTNSSSGTILALSQDPATLPSQIEVSNMLDQGSINANIYKNGKLLGTHTSVSPGQKAVFEFKPTIWIGVASQVAEGELMNSAILSELNTEISLLGVTKANIIMTGGGAGSTATPFVFTLQVIA